jgi:hypothetical protein
MRDLTKTLSAPEPYLLHIRSVFVTDRLRFHIRIRTQSALIPNPKNVTTNTVSLLSVHICSVFTPRLGGGGGFHYKKSDHLPRLELLVVAEDPPSTTILVDFMVD